MLGTEPAEATRRLRDEMAAGVFPRSTSGEYPQGGGPTSAGKHNLPGPMTSLVGREKEMVEVKRAVSMTRPLDTDPTFSPSGEDRLLDIPRRRLRPLYHGRGRDRPRPITNHPGDDLPRLAAGPLGFRGVRSDREKGGAGAKDLLTQYRCEERGYRHRRQQYHYPSVHRAIRHATVGVETTALQLSAGQFQPLGDPSSERPGVTRYIQVDAVVTISPTEKVSASAASKAIREG